MHAPLELATFRQGLGSAQPSTSEYNNTGKAQYEAYAKQQCKGNLMLPTCQNEVEVLGLLRNMCICVHAMVRCSRWPHEQHHAWAYAQHIYHVQDNCELICKINHQIRPSTGNFSFF
jgi:hypothetical protein